MMIKWTLAAACMCLLPAWAHAGIFEDDAPPPSISAPGTHFEAAFAPGDEVAPLVVTQILAAHSSIRVVAGSFLSKPISEALVKAFRLGREVQVVVDAKKNKTGYSAVPFLSTMGITAHAVKSDIGLQSNFMIIDDKEIIISDAVAMNDDTEDKKAFAQTLVIHDSPQLVEKYVEDWKALWSSSSVMKTEK